MSRTRIKICGVRRLEDALYAAGAGADAIGMVMHKPAYRYCRPDVARAIAAALPPFVQPVGLFLNELTQEIHQVAADIGISVVQLHGEETRDEVASLAPLKVIKTVRLDRRDPASSLAQWRDAPANVIAILLETPGSSGGAGKENDWPAIRQAIDSGLLANLPPLVVAGGLRPDNVSGVVSLLRPYAVDVSSGVEEIKGEKSPARVKAFIEAVRQADS